MQKSETKRHAILEASYRLFRTQGFEGTSVAEITAAVGGSKATIYSHFPSKEELFVECMMAAAERYVAGALKQLDSASADVPAALLEFGVSLLGFICSPEQLEVRRLVIAEAARSGTGRLFFNKAAALRSHVAAFMAGCMAAGSLRSDAPLLAADQLGALLEAELLEPLLLQVRSGSPSKAEITLAAEHAVSAFLRAYAPATPTSNAPASKPRLGGSQTRRAA